MSQRTRQTGWALALVMLAAGACTDGGLAPRDETFDTAAALADFAALTGIFDSGVWESFQVLGTEFGMAQQAATALRQAPDVLESMARSGPTETRRAALALAGGIVGAASDPATAAVSRIPTELRGRVFVIDPELGHYVIDPVRTGAPPNGVWFILYAIDPVTRQPILDVEVGYVEITDEGDALPTGVALRLRVVSQGITYVDYGVAADGTDATGSLDVDGFISDGRAQLQFDIQIAITRGGNTETMDVAFDIAMPDRGFRATATMRNVNAATGGSGDLDLLIQMDETVIHFVAAADDQTIDATFWVNGRVFATVSGPHEHPEVRGAGGRVLTAEEHRVLGQIVALATNVMEMLQHLLQPAGRILSLSMLP